MCWEKPLANSTRKVETERGYVLILGKFRPRFEFNTSTKTKVEPIGFHLFSVPIKKSDQFPQPDQGIRKPDLTI